MKHKKHKKEPHTSLIKNDNIDLCLESLRESFEKLDTDELLELEAALSHLEESFDGFDSSDLDYQSDMGFNSESDDSFTADFIGTVLLPKFKMHRDQIIDDFKKLWDIEIDDVLCNQKDSLVLQIGNKIVYFSLENVGIHKRQMIYAARTNELWDQAEETVKKATAYILVGLENDGSGDDNLLERAELLVKALAVCCHQKNALAVLSNYALHEIQTYLNLASLLKQGTFPVMCLVSFHFIQTEYGPSVCSMGFENFGYDEIEVLGYDKDIPCHDMLNFLSGIGIEIIKDGLDLNNIPTIEVSDKHRYKIEKSPAVCIPDNLDTIKLLPIRDL